MFLSIENRYPKQCKWIKEHPTVSLAIASAIVAFFGVYARLICYALNQGTMRYWNIKGSEIANSTNLSFYEFLFVGLLIITYSASLVHLVNSTYSLYLKTKSDKGKFGYSRNIQPLLGPHIFLLIINLFIVYAFSPQHASFGFYIINLLLIYLVDFVLTIFYLVSYIFIKDSKSFDKIIAIFLILYFILSCCVGIGYIFSKNQKEFQVLRDQQYVIVMRNENSYLALKCDVQDDKITIYRNMKKWIAVPGTEYYYFEFRDININEQIYLPSK